MYSERWYLVQKDSQSMKRKKNVHPPAQCPQVCIPKPNESKAHGMDEEKIMPRIKLGNNEVCLYPGGRGTQQSFIRGGSVPRSTPPHLIDHIWQKKGTPFVLFDKNGTLFTYLV